MQIGSNAIQAILERRAVNLFSQLSCRRETSFENNAAEYKQTGNPSVQQDTQSASGMTSP